MNDKPEKVIERDRVKLADNDTKKLSYELVFIPKKEETESIDLIQALERSNREWMTRLADEKQKAVKQGYDAGFADGEIKMRTQIREQIRPMEMALSELQVFMEQFTEILKPEIQKLVFLLAAKVVGVPVESEVLRKQVRDEIAVTLNELTEKTTAKIRVSDADFDTIQHLITESPVKNPVELMRDPALKPGEYRIETSLEEVARSFLQRLDDFRKISGIRFEDE